MLKAMKDMRTILTDEQFKNMHKMCMMKMGEKKHGKMKMDKPALKKPNPDKPKPVDDMKEMKH